MAEKRMFAKSIIDSDLFLDMPPTTQNLYFHLAMRADDEGFIDNAKRIMRDVRASDTDMRMLIRNKYIIPFESGVIVITHWRLHNWIRKERIRPTEYSDEKALLELDKSGKYKLKQDNVSQLSASCQPVVSQTSDTCQTDDCQLSAKCQSSIEENRVDKYRYSSSSSSDALTRDDHDNGDFKKVVRFFEENFGTVSGYAAEVLDSLIKDYSAEWVMHGMETCVKAGRQKCNIKYLEGVLKGWKSDGIAKPWEQEGHHGRGTQKHSGRGGQKAGGFDADAEREKWEHETSGWD